MTRVSEVLIVVRRGDDYLAVHRSPENGAYWHQISGGVEDGEMPAAAARRELREETGLDVEPESMALSFSYGGMHVDCFVAEAPAGWEPELDWEHDEYRWLGAADAAGLMQWPEPSDVLRSFA
jgi:lipoyl(octanoyl) transferase